MKPVKTRSLLSLLLLFSLAVFPGCAVFGLGPIALIAYAVVGGGGDDENGGGGTAIPAPDLVSIDPTIGNIAGGTTITLAGVNFQTGATVTVGGNACSGYDYSGIPTSFSCVTPGGTAGAKDVTVANPDNQSDTLAGAFTYSTTSSAAIGLSTTSVSFYATEGGANPADKSYDITNAGDTGTTLNWTASKTQSWLTVSPTSDSTTTESDTVTLSVDISGLSASSYNDTVTITDASASNSPRTVSVTLTVSPSGGPTLTTIAISPANPTIYLNTTKQFTAVGTYSDSSTADITDQVSWTSANAAAVTISNGGRSEGLATAVGSGTSAITATLASVTSNTSNATVSDAPVVWGVARYADVNKNGACDAGDTIVVPFNVDVTLNSPSASDFSFPVYDDTLGTGATIASGPGTNELTITLGSSPRITTRQDFTPARTDPYSPSGIEVSAGMAANAIENGSGTDAVASIPIDVFPAFVDSGQALGNSNSMSSALGDLDGDGDPDLVVGNSGSLPDRVYLNDGAGNFTDSGQALGSITTQRVTLGDVDGDGDLDLVCANRNGGNLVYLNNGSGTFTDSGQSLGSVNTQCVVFGDVDGDGDLDLGEANESGADRILLNNGSGTYTDSGQTLAGGGLSLHAIFCDIDNDGDLDYVIVTNSLSRIFLNNGSGTFTDSGQTLSSAECVAAGDIDGDGDMDLVFGIGLGAMNPNTVWFNNGSGTFTDSGQSLGNHMSQWIGLADLDADGDLDLIDGNMTAGSGDANCVWLNDGTGFFRDTGQLLGNFNNEECSMGDVDGDGDIDLVTADGAAHSSQPCHVYLNSLSGTWGHATFVDSGQALGSSSSFSCDLGDVDLDGDLDMVVGNWSSQADRVYLNDGAGTFTDSGQALGSITTQEVVLGDVDLDGDLDLVAANRNGGNLVFLNDGSGVFADSSQSVGSGSSYCVVLGDVDGDGDLDMGEGNDFGQANRIYYNDGSGTFSDSGQTLGSVNTYCVALCDVDGDGDLDFVTANIAANKVYLNNGSGTFTDSGQSLGSISSTRVISGDIDGDGDEDLVFSNAPDAANEVWLNNGSGVFTNSGQALGSYYTTAIGFFDFDGDGDLDIFEGNLSTSGGDANRVWLNDGNGIFTDSGQTLGSENTQGCPLGDIDGDGDIDVVCGNGHNINQSNRVYFNSIPGVTSISGGGTHSLALKSNGTVWTWGKGLSGEMGDGTTSSRSTSGIVPGLNGVKAISGGHAHSIALLSDGTIMTWGLNNFGQLGDGTKIPNNTLVSVSSLSGVVYISGANCQNFAALSDGTLWAWGSNIAHQLGDGTGTDRLTPVQVNNLTGIVSVSAGLYHSGALKGDGTVWMWGQNTSGECGQTASVAYCEPPAQVPGLTGVSGISLGCAHTMALKTDGTAWTWGANSTGKIGDGTTTPRSTPFQVMTGVRAVCAAMFHFSMALKTDGTVWTWGENTYGQLGDGSTTDRHTPVQVSGLTGIVAIAAGNEFAMALRADSTVWAWGRNEEGQLGDGTTTDRHTPVQVQGP